MWGGNGGVRNQNREKNEARVVDEIKEAHTKTDFNKKMKFVLNLSSAICVCPPRNGRSQEWKRVDKLRGSL